MKKLLIKRLLLFAALTALMVLAVGVAIASAETDLIPTMTSDTTPSGEVFYSSNYHNTQPGYLAFNDVSNSGYGWISASACSESSPQYLGYKFPSSQIVNQYSITNRGQNIYNPVTWKFQGSSDGNTWVDLDTRANISWTTGFQKQTFSFSNNNAYQWYRILVTANSNTYYVEIRQMEMMGPISPSVPTLSASVNGHDVHLSWTAVDGASSYKLKRGTDGLSFPTQETITDVVYKDYTLDPGIYYFVVTAVDTNNNESEFSNVVQVIIEDGPDPIGGTLLITMNNGDDRQYDLTMTEIEAFITWYSNRSTEGNVYIIDMGASGAYKNIKDYLVFDKIVAWKVMEY